jgi:hypothetical protein
MRISILCVLLLAAAPAAAFEVEQHGNLGQYGTNLGDPNLTPNAFGVFGNLYGDTIDDPDSTFGAPNSGQGAANLDATNAPKPFSSQGKFWSRFSIAPHHPGAVSNPNGRFSNPYSSDSDNNPYGAGNPYAPNSPANPYGAGNPYAPNSPANPYFGNGSFIAGQ